MEFKQIQELIKTINKSNISELSIKDGEFEITIRQEQEMDMSGFMPMPQQYMQQPQMPMPQQASPMPASSVQIQVPVTTTPGTETQTAAGSQSASGTPIKSPMIGTFYRSPAPDKAPFVNVGDEIKKGQVLCVIEAMKLFNEIESEVSGRLVKVCVDDATPVEYDQPLFIVEPI